MSTTPFLVLFLYWLNPVTFASQSEENLSIGIRIEHRIKSKESKWRLKTTGTGGKSVKQEWKSGDKFVTVSISKQGSAQEACDFIEAVPSSISMAEITELNNIGEKAYLIKPSRQIIHSGGRGNRGLIFIRSNVLINIYATSEEAAVRFARCIAEEIKAHSNK